VSVLRRCGAYAGGGEDPADRARAQTVSEPGEFTLDSPVTQDGFSYAKRRTRSRISSLRGGRPDRFGQVHFLVTRRRRQANSVPGVTSRWRRIDAGAGGSAQTGSLGPAMRGRGLLT
jgi:hypothetical protein